MRKSVKKDPSYKARNAVLDLVDPMGVVEIDGGFEETLGTTLQDICDYIEQCLQFSDNPLIHLRRYFPNYLWSFHKPETKEEVAKIVSVVDYALPDSTGFTDWSMGVFTATHKNCLFRKKICFCTVSDHGPNLDCWPYEELEKVGASVVINDPKATIDTRYKLMIVSPVEALKIQTEKRKKILGR